MTYQPELAAALVRDRLELHRRMRVLRLLDRMQAAFGHEAVAVGTTGTLRPVIPSPAPSSISGTLSRSVFPSRWARSSLR
jgi:hypothetical protein